MYALFTAVLCWPLLRHQSYKEVDMSHRRTCLRYAAYNGGIPAILTARPHHNATDKTNGAREQPAFKYLLYLHIDAKY